MAKEKLSKPIFIISLDTELLWGYVAHPTLKAVRLMENDSRKVRGCVDILLNLFEKHNIPATWAIVGHLFLDHCECEDGIQHLDTCRGSKMIGIPLTLAPIYKGGRYTMEGTSLRKFYQIELNMKLVIIHSLMLSFLNAVERLPKQR